MSTAISSSSAQDAYRSQLASSRSERSINSLTSSLKSAEKMASAIGADSSGLKNALQQISGTTSTSTAGSSTKVSLSSEGVARQQSEVSRPERRQFGSIDEAIAYGTARAAEQQQATRTVDSADKTSASSGSSRRQFASVDEAIAYGTARAAEQSGRSSQTASQNEASTGNGRRQFASTEEAIAYGTQRALEQYNKQKLALGSASS
ncbi:hypothetical protein DFR40_2702 [Azonexus fungiphilus]|uniref:Uncharacterized protein n=1 Tax=Azonexus fungiphilus TaxID=146940 RepID=A0A495VQ89_9RHOO|nr:hypothetical protein [Azonexus fungiphilus]RKT50767.1 hypothetical protein DFR40_2702 [Azonexus fungiphilus]